MNGAKGEADTDRKKGGGGGGEERKSKGKILFDYFLGGGGRREGGGVREEELGGGGSWEGGLMMCVEDKRAELAPIASDHNSFSWGFYFWVGQEWGVIGDHRKTLRVLCLPTDSALPSSAPGGCNHVVSRSAAGYSGRRN